MNTFKRLVRPEQLRELSLLLIVIFVIFLFGREIQNYYTGRTFVRISTSIAIITVAAVGQTMVIITRNVDLSIGSIIGFTAYFVGQQVSENNDIAPLVVVGMAIATGALLGLINGILVAYGKIPSIVVTLGTLALYRGLLVEYSDAQSILTSNLPDWIDDFPRETLIEGYGFDIRLLVGIALAVVVIFQLVLMFTRFGRRLYAVGSNPDAAETAGIPARRVVLSAFVLSGALSGLAGFMFLARFGNITVTAAQGWELQVVAAVIVGGVNIFGGTGTVIGAFLGAILIGTLDQSLIRTEISQFWQDALQGIFILAAIVLDAFILNRIRDWWVNSELRLQEPIQESSHATD